MLNGSARTTSKAAFTIGAVRGVDEESEEEDTTDAAFLRRHIKCESDERRRFNDVITLPVGSRRSSLAGQKRKLSISAAEQPCTSSSLRGGG